MARGLCIHAVTEPVSEVLSAPAEHAAERVIRSLCHALRGRMSRLHLRIELAPLEETLKSLMLAEVLQMDALLHAHRALLQASPQDVAGWISIQQAVAPLQQDPLLESRIQYHTSLAQQVRAWPEVLAGALRPLLLNALQHGAEPVRLSADVEHDGIWIRCTDSGTGFPPADLPRLTIPFEHVSAGSHRGAGIGLAVAKRMAGFLGARLHAAACAEGFAVSLVLPLECRAPRRSSNPE